MEKVMHETARRLFEAAKKIRPDIEKPADLARALNQSEQTINNWSYRPNGVSKQGRLIAQKELGISATWIEDGTGDMLAGTQGHTSTRAKPGNTGPSTGEIEAPRVEAPATLDVRSMTSPQRLHLALRNSPTQAPELASVAGVGVEVATQWLNGNGPEISLAQASALQDAYGINMVWLAKGIGDPGVAVQFADDWNPIPISEMFGVPVRGRAQLGDNGYWADLEYPDGHGDGYVDIPKRSRDTYALKCVGDSMRPRIKNGEYVVIEPSHPYSAGDEVLVKSKDGRVMVKVFLFERDGRVHLSSINENHPPFALERSNIEKIHYVASINKPSQWRPD